MSEFSSVLKQKDSPAFRSRVFLFLQITVRPGPLKKEEKKRKYNGLTGRQRSLSRPDFSLGLPSNTETPTLEIVTGNCCYLRDPQFNNFFNSGLFTGLIFS